MRFFIDGFFVVSIVLMTVFIIDLVIRDAGNKEIDRINTIIINSFNEISSSNTEELTNIINDKIKIGNLESKLNFLKIESMENKYFCQYSIQHFYKLHNISFDVF